LDAKGLEARPEFLIPVDEMLERLLGRIACNNIANGHDAT
jgi:hypothetical protein